MKAAPLLTAIREHNERALQSPLGSSEQSPLLLEPILVHTGQHYDRLMSDAFFADLNLPEPDIHLGVGSGTHAVQTAEIMRKFEEVLLSHRPDVVVVVGDVNSTLACALVTAKISFDSNGTRPLLAHVEAGLRSFDRSMPEECNRILTDHLSDLLFVTEKSALENLNREGIPPTRMHFVGNTMIDSLLTFKEKAGASPVLDTLGLRRPNPTRYSSNGVVAFGILTLHRPSNVDNRENFRSILEGLQEFAINYPIIFPAHPRTQQRIHEFGLEDYFVSHPAEHRTGAAPKIILLNPLRYLEFLCLMQRAKLVLTDSGGIQEETTCLGVRCVTIRENTERPITVEMGTNVIAGVTKEGIREAIRYQLTRRIHAHVPEKWDGNASRRIVVALVSESQRTLSPRKAEGLVRLPGRCVTECSS